MPLPPIYLTGTLAEHRRGRVLKSTLNAQSTTALPSQPSIALLFGSDFQEGSKEIQQWFQWSQEAGHTLLLIPPFKSTICSIPITWEAMRRIKPALMQNNSFLQALASEVQYEFRGQFQIAQPNGTWDDQSFCTIYYRKHPHSGVFALTSLPLWSLLVLDHSAELQNWLATLYTLVGTTRTAPTEEKSDFQPQPHHFTLLLHLVTGHFTDVASALAALQASPIFWIDAAIAEASLRDLQLKGFVDKVTLTPAGRSLLANSPYATYAQELETMAS